MSSKPLAIAALLVLAGCRTTSPDAQIAPQAGSLDAGFGEVTRHNAAVMIIDPDPVYTAEDAQPGDHGEKAANAAKRYRTDQVKDTQPAGVTTRRAGGGAGASGPR
jgi:hypothetical protein